MADTMIVRFTDDIDGGEAAARHTVTVDGRTVEIDLSERNWRPFREQFAVLEQHGRRLPARRSLGAAAPGRRRGAASAARREELAAIRAWARENGHPVAARGRIPLSVEAAWRAAAARTRVALG